MYSNSATCFDRFRDHQQGVTQEYKKYTNDRMIQTYKNGHLLKQYSNFSQCLLGKRWRSWVSHCATSREVAGSIPDGVIGIFLIEYKPSGRTMALGLTEPLTEISTRNISWG